MACVFAFFLQNPAQSREPVKNAGLHRSKRALKHFGNLFVAQSFAEPQDERLALPIGQAGHPGPQALLPFGHFGGLGIVTFVAAGQIFSARRMSVPQQVLLKEVLSTRNLADVRRHVRDVVLLVLGVELLGAAALYLTVELEAGPGQRAFWSLFHAVSAFCNAGNSWKTGAAAEQPGAGGDRDADIVLDADSCP